MSWRSRTPKAGAKLCLQPRASSVPRVPSSLQPLRHVQKLKKPALPPFKDRIKFRNVNLSQKQWFVTATRQLKAWLMSESKFPSVFEKELVEIAEPKQEQSIGRQFTLDAPVL